MSTPLPPSSSTSYPAPNPRNALSLPLATGPDIMLSWEKDTFYAKQIHQQLKVRWLMG